MNAQEFVEKRMMRGDLDYLHKMGFEVKLVRNENKRFDVEYMTHIIQGNNIEIISTPYQLEQVVKILRMAERLRRNK